MAKDAEFKKPFDGAISKFAEKKAPKRVRDLLKDSDKRDVLDPDYPYRHVKQVY